MSQSITVKQASRIVSAGTAVAAAAAVATLLAIASSSDSEVQRLHNCAILSCVNLKNNSNSLPTE